MNRLSSSIAKNKTCPACRGKDVRGMPSPCQGKRYRSFACASCMYTWTQGHRGYAKHWQQK